MSQAKQFLSHPNISTIQTSGQFQILNCLLEQSRTCLLDQTLQKIKKQQKFNEQKVFRSQTEEPHLYLSFILNNSEQSSVKEVTRLLKESENNFYEKIKCDLVCVVDKDNNKKDMNELNKQLSHKIIDLKSQFGTFITTNEQTIKSESRLKGTKNQEQSSEIQKRKKNKELILKLQRQKLKMQEDRNGRRIKSQILFQQQQQRETQRKQELLQKELQKRMWKRDRIRSERILKMSDHHKRTVSAVQFLHKFKLKSLIKTNSQQQCKQFFNHELQQSQMNVLSLKKNHSSLNYSQFEQHRQKYQELKSKLARQSQQQKGKWKQLKNKNLQKLKSLYHSRFYQRLLNTTESTGRTRIEEKQKVRDKIKSYSTGVKEQFRPKIDEAKKLEICENKKKLQLYNLRKKQVKNQDGSVSLSQFPQGMNRKLGVEYLQDLRRLNSEKKNRNKKSASLINLQNNRFHYPDYLTARREKLRENEDRFRSGWLKSIKQKNVDREDKIHEIFGHVETLEREAKQKQLELKYSKDHEDCKRIKDRLNNFYFESANAKVYLINQVIFNE